jgi:Domain of unknown function (DUF927)
MTQVMQANEQDDSAVMDDFVFDPTTDFKEAAPTAEDIAADERAKAKEQELNSEEAKAKKAEEKKLYEATEKDIAEARAEAERNAAEAQGYTNKIVFPATDIPRYIVVEEKSRVYANGAGREFVKADPGVYVVEQKLNRKTMTTTHELLHICTPLKITSRTADVDDHNSGVGRVIEFVNDCGRWTSHVVELHELFGTSRDAIVKYFSERGVKFKSRGILEFVDYLQWAGASQDSVTYTTSQIGWHGDVFVLPEESIGGDIKFINKESDSECPYVKRGTLEGWQEIAKMIEGSPISMLATAATFAGPLMKKHSTELGIGIHFFGETSKGKTTAISAAVSAWGVPKHLVNNWNNTIFISEDGDWTGFGDAARNYESGLIGQADWKGYFWVRPRKCYACADRCALL